MISFTAVTNPLMPHRPYSSNFFKISAFSSFTPIMSGYKAATPLFNASISASIPACAGGRNTGTVSHDGLVA